MYHEMSIKVHRVIYRLIRKIFRNHYAKEKFLSVTHTFYLSCSSVIEYSRKPDFAPVNVFLYEVFDADFHMVCL